MFAKKSTKIGKVWLRGVRGQKTHARRRVEKNGNTKQGEKVYVYKKE